MNSERDISSAKYLAVSSIHFVCPLCRGPVASVPGAYSCKPCNRTYPVVFGIPDFRVFPDPYIGFEQDYAKAGRLLERTRGCDFEGVLRAYWSMTPEVEPQRAERFIQHALALKSRAAESLSVMDSLAANRLEDATLLDVGCGTGGFLLAAREHFRTVIGYDIAFRWLVVAQRQLQENGIDVPLVCGCAEYLPFPNNSFTTVVAADLIEHVRDQRRTLTEMQRVMTDDGVCFLTTPNRLSLAPDPHVRVWGLGYLPRRLMPAYVRVVKGVPYRFIRTLSYFELARLLFASGFRIEASTFPRIPARQRKSLKWWEQWLLRAYERLQRVPLLRSVLYVLGPGFQLLVRKNG